MKTVLLKTTVDKMGDYSGTVFLPLMGDTDSIPEGYEVAATLSIGASLLRSIKQNASIHKYCTILAKEFESRGLDMQAVLAMVVPIKWTMESVKEVIWRRIQVAMFPEKPSTTQLEKAEVNEVYQVISRHLSTEFEITQSFPSRHGE